MDHWDTDKIELNGRTYLITYDIDDWSGAPWEECDGHGVVTDWERRDKHPGERVLHTDSPHWKRFYNVHESIKIAHRDGWGLGSEAEARLRARLGRAPTKRERIAEAVNWDFHFLRAWCQDQWSYLVVGVTNPETGETDYIGRVESYDGYHEQMAREMVAEMDAKLTRALEAARRRDIMNITRAMLR